MDTQNPQHNETTQTSAPANTMDNNTVMAVLAYIGPLVLVSWLTAKDNPFVKFHIKQGLVLVVIEIIVWILASILWQLGIVWSLINLITLVLSIIGIINAAQGKMKDLPVVGQYASSFKF